LPDEVPIVSKKLWVWTQKLPPKTRLLILVVTSLTTKE
jgi:hypothetical protein